MKKIIVITDGYPNPTNRTQYAFVKELVEQWKMLGCEVMVVRPMTLKNFLCSQKESGKNGVYYPLFVRFRFLRIFKALRIIQTKIADWSYQKAVERCIKSYENVVLYSHFLCSGLVASRIAQKQGIDSYCAFGESGLWFLNDRKTADVESDLRKMTGYIAVSSENREILVSQGWATEDRIITAINAVDIEKFAVYSKTQCRQKLGFPEDGIIGIFVGHFNERKGSLRVDEASQGIENLKMIYVGAGELEPKSENIIFKGKVAHEELVDYLCASDFFVLPTQAEGCCNAIVEALACGLPIISSDGKFNDDILNEKNSIRIPANDIRQLREAITSLVDNSVMLGKMRNDILEKREELSIKHRARKILDFMKEDVVKEERT